MRSSFQRLAWVLCLGASAAAAQDPPSRSAATLPGRSVDGSFKPAVVAPGAKAVAVEVAILEFADLDTGPAAPEAETPERTLARVRELEKAGKRRRATKVRLMTVDGVNATAQQGENIATPAGNANFGGARPQMMYGRQEVGTLVSLVARVEEEGTILLDLSVERSRPADPPDGQAEVAGPDDLPAAVPVSIEKLISRSTLRLRDGESMLADARETSVGGRSSLLAVVVTARKAASQTGPAANR